MFVCLSTIYFVCSTSIWSSILSEVSFTFVCIHNQNRLLHFAKAGLHPKSSPLRFPLPYFVLCRSFGGKPSQAEGYDHVDKLKASVKAAGKSFNPDRFVAAGYDPPVRLINRHNEVWIFAE